MDIEHIIKKHVHLNNDLEDDTASNVDNQYAKQKEQADQTFDAKL
jgi:hypothetical protein